MTHYNIYFTGKSRDGVSKTQLQQNLIRLFKIDVSKIQALFCGKPVIIKKNLPKAQLHKYCQALQKAGARIVVKEIKPVSVPTTPNTTLDKTQPPPSSNTQENSNNNGFANPGLANLVNFNQVTGASTQPTPTQTPTNTQSIQSTPPVQYSPTASQSSDDKLLLPANSGSLEEFSRQNKTFEMPDVSAYQTEQEFDLSEFSPKKTPLELPDISYMDITDQNDRPLSDQSKKPKPVELPDISHLDMSLPEQGSLEEFSQPHPDFDLQAIADLPLENTHE